VKPVDAKVMLQVWDAARASCFARPLFSISLEDKVWDAIHAPVWERMEDQVLDSVISTVARVTNGSFLTS